MVLSGIVAAVLKERANDQFSQYRQTLDQAALDRSRQLDRQSAAVLAVTQVSFAALCYFLLSE